MKYVHKWAAVLHCTGFLLFMLNTSILKYRTHSCSSTGIFSNVICLHVSEHYTDVTVLPTLYRFTCILRIKTYPSVLVSFTNKRQALYRDRWKGYRYSINNSSPCTHVKMLFLLTFADRLGKEWLMYWKGTILLIVTLPKKHKTLKLAYKNNTTVKWFKV